MLYHLTIYFLGDQVLTLTACLLGCAFMNDIRFRISVFMVDRLGIVVAPYCFYLMIVDLQIMVILVCNHYGFCSCKSTLGRGDAASVLERGFGRVDYAMWTWLF